MRGEVDPQSSMFHYFSVESRIPADHPLRPVKKLADSMLSAISADRVRSEKVGPARHQGLEAPRVYE